MGFVRGLSFASVGGVGLFGLWVVVIVVLPVAGVFWVDVDLGFGAFWWVFVVGFGVFWTFRDMVWCLRVFLFCVMLVWHRFLGLLRC